MDKIRERITIFGISAVILLIGFVVFRFVLFGMHGMKEWPMDLLIVGLIVCLIGAAIKGYFTCTFTVCGYILGFALAVNYGATTIDPVKGASSNAWIIWTAIFVIGIITGLVVDIFMKLRTKKS